MKHKRNSYSKLSLILMLTGLGFCLPVGLFPAFAETTDQNLNFDSILYDLDTEPEIKKLRISYTKDKPLIKRICRELDNDGRRDLFFNVVNLLQIEDKDCSACRFFFRAWVSSCKPRRQKIERERDTQPKLIAGSTSNEANPADTQPKQPIVQREPSATLIDLASRLSIQLADSELGPETLKAAQKLKSVLTPKYLNSKGASEYFEIFAIYFLSGFNELLAKQAREQEEEHDFFSK